MRERAVRRMAGLLRARLPELGLEEVPDPRAREGRWSLAQIPQATLLGLMAGSRSLWEAEQLTANLAPAMRRQLGLPRAPRPGRNRSPPAPEAPLTSGSAWPISPGPKGRPIPSRQGRTLRSFACPPS